jgi:penicillin-binding protein 1B
MFANRGIVSKPNWIRMIRSHKGSHIFESQPQRKAVLDPRVNYLMVSLMQEVMRSGTAAGVRSRGFTLPAAGKTGTSRDGWFAGFTSRLVCVVWVGFDDAKDLNLEGAKSALPIWTEFMKRAHQRREYRNVRDWDAPDGIVSVDIDPLSGQLATGACPSSRPEYFVSGTQPVEMCRLHGGGGTQVAGWETTPATAAASAIPAQSQAPVSDQGRQYGNGRNQPPGPVAETSQSAPAQTSAEKPREKRGFFGKIKDIFK